MHSTAALERTAPSPPTRPRLRMDPAAGAPHIIDMCPERLRLALHAMYALNRLCVLPVPSNVSMLPGPPPALSDSVRHAHRRRISPTSFTTYLRMVRLRCLPHPIPYVGWAIAFYRTAAPHLCQVLLKKSGLLVQSGPFTLAKHLFL